MLGIITSWLTPSVLFCLMNLMIGTIFLSSSLNHKKHSQPEPGSGLARSPSLLDRARSFNFSFNTTQRSDHDQEEPHGPGHTRMFSAPSLLERARSIDFSSYLPKYPDPDPNPNSLTRAPSFLERALSIKSFACRTGTSDPDSTNPNPLTRAPSFLERALSIKSFTYGTGPPDPVQSDPTQMNRTMVMMERLWASKSSGDGPENPGPVKPDPDREVRMRKSASEREMKVEEEVEEEVKRPKTTRETKKKRNEGSVDEKADDFISRFRNQLKLQRLDSIVRYKEMLNRGVGGR